MNRTLRRAALHAALSALPALAAAQNATYCLSISYAAVPSLVNDHKLTLNVAVGACSGVSVTADGAWVPATYSSSTQAASFSTSGTAIAITALNSTAAGTGAATNASLYSNYHWAYSQTFDDTRQSQYDYAKPILDALGWKAGIAAVGSWITSGGSYYMSWAEVQALRADGWQVYNHTWDHPDPVSCANFPTEFNQDQTAFQTYLPGYNVSHVVYPYEVSTATCSGWPPSYIISGELGGSGYTHVDTVLGKDYTVPRNGLYGTDPTNIETVSAQAAADSRPSWVICITHSVTQGSGAAADAYSTNQSALNTLYTYLGNNFGAAGNKSMWFAPSGEVMDYLFTRDNAVVSTCVAASPTPSPRQTGTPSSTATPAPRTPTSSPSATAAPSTATSTASDTPSRTATPSLTGTPSPTAAPSSPTCTSTALPSTATSTSTATHTSTSTKTPTPSPSATSSRSATFTQTAEPSPGPSGSPTPSDTAEPSGTFTITPSFSATRPDTATQTATLSASATPTPSSTASAVQSTATAEPSGTSSCTALPTGTRTDSPSSTSTQSQTGTATASPSPTFAATPSGTCTGTRTVTPAATSTASSSATCTAMPSATCTATPTLTLLSTASPSPALGPGSLQILQALPAPNPDPRQVWILLNGPADQVVMRIWSSAYVLVAEAQPGPCPRGWSALALPTGFRARASNGVYFITLEAERQGQVARAKPLKCLILH